MINIFFFLVLIVAMALSAAAVAEEKTPSGTVEINEYELAYIFNGQMGGGKLQFQGNTYDFKLGGVGVGGIGASHISAYGDVYNLTDVSQFPGTYVQASVGYSATDQGEGHLWLQNGNGVVLHLTTSQQGLGLTAGADGIQIMMKQ
ncbi:hypothetical protein [Desulforhabdus amnigena]|jgi:hypothetical protein|nr:hypothetical protein [Desulforhabdus amnigena]NLJ27871.1 DUF1134 domain-containing protein [Deltaproteobacteria bacterium]